MFMEAIVAAIVAGICAALVAIFGSIVFPTLKFMREDIKRLNKEVANCHREREQDQEWRARWEPIILDLQNVSLTAVITAQYDNNGQLKIVDANPAATKIFGYTTTELVGMHVHSLIAPGDRSAHHHAAMNFRDSDVSVREINHGSAIDSHGRKFSCTVFIERVNWNGKPAVAASITKDS